MMLTGNSTKDTIARAARQYTEIGWPVFAESYIEDLTCSVCQIAHTTDESMESCSCLRCHGVFSATADRKLVREMFRGIPRPILNIRTGAVSGLVAIEITSPVGVQTAARLDRAGLLPNTVTARTGGGGGYLIYKHPGGYVPSVRDGLGPGVHVHGENGWFMAPPTRNPRNGSIITWLSGKAEKPVVEPHPRIISNISERFASAA
ncbi:bifunctional DNA primase/polymerase [Nonomuraea wenchangensis]|uniref:Bifunctional DNA primase/polymerase, N-terminal n=1 Tax=Nonomuraea wenchangensis TaxID=568860 RepID=A0A1I0LF43_9ACTN|nr:bifunctional DNA primase/polymerase [Nonomuraea wenchangensis]SEU38706.1 Bifunctional DNA primase/polymerase, N-terminal [Nonomuraea wenchangensis]